MVSMQMVSSEGRGLVVTINSTAALLDGNKWQIAFMYTNYDRIDVSVTPMDKTEPSQNLRSFEDQMFASPWVHG